MPAGGGELRSTVRPMEGEGGKPGRYVRSRVESLRHRPGAAADEGTSAALPVRSGSSYEETLVVRAKAGDLGAMSDLLSVHQAAAQRVALILAPTPEDAAEAVQEGFLRAFRAIGRFETGRPFRPWLMRIVANEARGMRRRTARRMKLTARVVETYQPEIEASPEGIFVRRERGLQLLAALENLSDRDKLVITYRYLLEMSEADAAVALGVRPGTVKSRLSRALAELRRRIAARPDRDAW